PLGHQARADQDIEASLGERVDDPFGGAPMLDDVAIQPPDAQAGERLAHLALDPLRPATKVPDPWRCAVRAARGERRRPSAVVAAQGGLRLVVDKRSFAVRTGLDVAAVP